MTKRCRHEMFARLVVSGGGLPHTPLALRVKSGRTYLLGAYVLARTCWRDKNEILARRANDT